MVFTFVTPASYNAYATPSGAELLLAGSQLSHSPLQESHLQEIEVEQLGELSPQQHRAMRLMSQGHSNSSIAEQCNISAKAAERTIAAASRILKVEPSSRETNHRVHAAMKYQAAMLQAANLQFE